MSWADARALEMGQQQTPAQIAAVRESYRTLFSTPEGQIVLSDLRRFGRMLKTVHVREDESGRTSAFLEGRRLMVLYIEAMRADGDDALRLLLS